MHYIILREQKSNNKNASFEFSFYILFYDLSNIQVNIETLYHYHHVNNVERG